MLTVKPRVRTSGKNAKAPVAMKRTFSIASLGIGALIMLLVLVAVGGGSARHDVASLIFLRPAAFLAIGCALLALSRETWHRLPLPFYVVLALGAVCLAQLVPLPPSLWATLPHRDVVHQIDSLVGLGELWRPITLAPARTWNTFFALSIPAATFLLIATYAAGYRERILQAVLLVGVASIGLGFLQAIGGADSLFYTYRIHTDGQAVGLFANRNHQGAFLAIVIVVSAILIARIDASKRSGGLQVLLYTGVITIIVPFVLVLGSRAGLLLSVVALSAAPFIAGNSPWIRARAAQLAKTRGARPPSINPRVVKVLAVIGALGLMAGLVYFNSRNEALDRLAAGGEASPLSRSEVFSTLVQMSRDFFPFGSGFGSFDAVFRFYETAADLSPSYLNQAHNDWLQLVIESGAAGLALMLLFFVWLLRTALGVLRIGNGRLRAEQLGLVLCLLLIGAASVVDYPARVPIFMMLFAAICSLLSQATEPTKQSRADIVR